MKLKEGDKFYKFKLFFVRARHGLLLMTFRSFLAKLGLDIGLYYWVLEGAKDIALPKLKNNSILYDFIELSSEDIHSLSKVHFISSSDLIKRTNYGFKVVGLKSHTGDIAAFMCIDYKDFVYKERKFELKQGEAYLLNMYTFQEYRGQNLAPYLRYKSYELLKEEGITKIYSITDYFNSSSQKFKSKLNAENISLYFRITLFKRYNRTIKIKDYGQNLT